MDQEIRIKYFPPNDLMFHHYLKEIDKNHNEIKNIQISDLNDAIEAYNIAQYFQDSRIHWHNWEKEELIYYKKEFNNLAHKFIHTLTNDNFTNWIEKLFIDYFDDFITLFEQTKIYKQIEKTIIQTEFNNDNYNLFAAITKNKILSNYYSQEIYNYFECCIESAELIIRSVNMDDVYIPEIVKNNQEYFIERYIKLPEPNINYLNMIQEVQYKPQISPKLKQLAKHKIEELNQKYMKENHLFTTEYEVAFVKGQTDKVKIEKDENNKVIVTYSQDWLDNNTDFYSLIGNFVDMFGYLDEFGRITDIYKPIENVLTEKLDFNDNKGTYRTNYVFNLKNDLSIQTTNLYKVVLENKNIFFEDMINWFFKEYLPKDFSLPEFRFSVPSKNSTIAEKCQILSSSLESLIKQYKYYVEDKELDFELISIDTQSVDIEKLPSLLKNKYVYGNGIEYQNLTHLLFSDQSDIAYNQNIKKNYKSFAELITNEKLKKEDFLNYQLRPLTWLFETGIIYTDEKGFLSFTDTTIIGILFNLYKDDFIPYWNIPDYDRKKISELDSKGYIKFTSNFLSDQEADYFNYYLNKKFSNGLEIRNQYAHGMAQISKTEDEIYKDYLIILKLVFIFLLKMDNEANIYNKSK